MLHSKCCEGCDKLLFSTDKLSTKRDSCTSKRALYRNEIITRANALLIEAHRRIAPAREAFTKINELRALEGIQGIFTCG